MVYTAGLQHEINFIFFKSFLSGVKHVNFALYYHSRIRDIV